MHRLAACAVFWLFCSSFCCLAQLVLGAAKPHVISFGKGTNIRRCAERTGAKCVSLKMRPFYVDGWARESTLGASHDITERLFVVRRAFRVNDPLPAEAGAPSWMWQRGGWRLADRMAARISPPVALPEYDS